MSTTIIALYAAFVSTATAIFGIWNAVSQRRPKLYVDLHPLAIVNTGVPVRSGLAIEVVNIGPIPVHVDGVGVPLDRCPIDHVWTNVNARGTGTP